MRWGRYKTHPREQYVDRVDYYTAAVVLTAVPVYLVNYLPGT